METTSPRVVEAKRRLTTHCPRTCCPFCEKKCHFRVSPVGEEEHEGGQRFGWEYRLGKLHSQELAYCRVTVEALNALQKKFIDGAQGIPALMYSSPDSGDKKYLWKMTSGTDLAHAVHEVRGVLEALLFHEKDASARPKGSDLLSGESKNERWRLICQTAMRLMRPGVDSPVQWSAHNQRNHFRLTVITKHTLLELVGSMVVIIDTLLEPKQSCKPIHKALIASFATELQPKLNKDGQPAKNQKFDIPFNEFLLACSEEHAKI
ncbi:hypothetical protein AB1Y20_020719 [Prymnesium parvum]|uniref:Inositol-pentakisphosphate 2-kinase n=1 Tax=Prymnesium parvum TaxID=97485 RepID=A0AB34JVK1_PRYPA